MQEQVIIKHNDDVLKYPNDRNKLANHFIDEDTGYQCDQAKFMA